MARIPEEHGTATAGLQDHKPHMPHTGCRTATAAAGPQLPHAGELSLCLQTVLRAALSDVSASSSYGMAEPVLPPSLATRPATGGACLRAGPNVSVLSMQVECIPSGARHACTWFVSVYHMDARVSRVEPCGRLSTKGILHQGQPDDLLQVIREREGELDTSGFPTGSVRSIWMWHRAQRGLASRLRRHSDCVWGYLAAVSARSSL